MKIKITVVALLAVTAGVFAYTRSHNTLPSDLRDAVADFTDIKVSDIKAGSSADIPMPAQATCPTSTLDRSRKEVRDLIERDPFCEGVAVSIIDGKKGNPYVNVILKGENTSGCAEIMKDRAGRIGMSIYSSDVLDVTPPTAYLRFQDAR